LYLTPWYVVKLASIRQWVVAPSSPHRLSTLGTTPCDLTRPSHCTALRGLPNLAIPPTNPALPHPAGCQIWPLSSKTLHCPTQWIAKSGHSVQIPCAAPHSGLPNLAISAHRPCPTLPLFNPFFSFLLSFYFIKWQPRSTALQVKASQPLAIPPGCQIWPSWSQILLAAAPQLFNPLS
jgi:hypothetical protein